MSLSGWRSSLSLTNVISNLLYSNPTAGPSSNPEPSENDNALPDASHTLPGQPQNEPQRLDDTTGLECLVCTSYSDEVDFSTEPPTSACSHSPEVCVDCLQHVILTAINSGEFITGILCPSSDCSQKLDYYDVHKWATQEVFDRYDKLLLQNSLRTDGHYVLCLEPSCAAGQVHTGGEFSNIVTCHHCGSKQCFRHQVLWHEGFTCEQWDEHQKTITGQQEMTDEWIQAETKPCPGPGCGRRIQKDEGCDHMTCKRPGGCGYQFCWECFASWLEIIAVDNSRHYDHCQYYTGPPGNNPAPPEIKAASTTAREPLPPIITPQPRPIFTFLAFPNGQVRQPARQPVDDATPGEARRLARLRNRGARIIEDRAPHEPFADAGPETLARRGGRLNGGQNADGPNPLPHHDRPHAEGFRLGQRGFDDVLRGGRDHDRTRQVLYDSAAYTPRRYDDRRERPRERPNFRDPSERDRELRRIQNFRARPPPLTRTRPFLVEEELRNGGLRPRRPVEDLPGGRYAPTTGQRGGPPPHLASRYTDLVPGSPQDYLLNSLFGPRSPQPLEHLNTPRSMSQAVAGPGPETQRRRRGMDPGREAEISAWAQDSNAPRVVQRDRLPERRPRGPFAPAAGSLIPERHSFYRPPRDPFVPPAGNLIPERPFYRPPRHDSPTRRPPV